MPHHGRNQVEAAKTLSHGIESAGDSIVAAAAIFTGGLVVSGIGRAIGAVFELVVERLREERQRAEVTDSIQGLQERHPRMSFTFLVQRSFAAGTIREERETIINGLIADGIGGVS